MTDDLRAAAEIEPVTADGLRAMGGRLVDGQLAFDFDVADSRKVRVFCDHEVALVWSTKQCATITSLGYARNLHDVRQLVDVLKRIGGGA